MPHSKKATGTVVGGMRNVGDKTPYLRIVDDPRATSGKGSTQPTLFGVIGRTHMDPYQQSLQNVVMNSVTPGRKHTPVLSDVALMSHHGNTDRHIISHKPATHIPGIHHGMVPYAGYYMSCC
jgi:hypothetical protein